MRDGDTLFGIAEMFGVSVNTIIWANDTVTAKSLRPGQVLTILPVTGTMHTVAKGDTLSSIAKKYKADAGEIAAFNGLDASAPLAVGTTIIIPDGEGAVVSSGSLVIDGHVVSTYNPYRGGSGPNEDSYYTRPLAGGVMTQGLHGYNAVDIGTPTGTQIYAAAAGDVIIAKSSGWNGGYGDYVVISHGNGTETLYAHLSKVEVVPGQIVAQGQTIALSGTTGESTGPHLHFEVRGAHNFMLNPSEY